MSGLTRLVIRTKRSRPRRRRQHDSNRGSLSEFESSSVLICHVLARTTSSRAPTALYMHRPDARWGEHLPEVNPTPLGVSPIGREAALPLLLSILQEGGRPKERPELLFAVVHDDECQPTWATRCWASLLAVFDRVGSVRTVAFCPSQSRVSRTISPSGNSSAS